MLFLLLAEFSFAFHAGQLRTSRQPRLPAIHSCAAPPPKPPPKPPQPVETPVAASPSGQPSGAAEKEKAYSSDWSGAGRFADDDPLPLSFWLFGPNPRRAILPTLLIWGMIAPATNLWGSGSFLLSLAPEASRSQRLDTFYPVSERRFFPYDKGYLDYSPGFKRFYDDQARFEFRYPATYVRDQAVYLRQADAAYTRRMLATTGLSGGAQPRRPSGPEVAFGPDSSSGTSARDENLSVVVGSAGPGFTLQRLGSPSEAAERLLENTIGKQAVVEKTELLGATERRSARSGTPLYQFEYRVDYVDAQQPPSYTVCVVGASKGQLFTFASRVPAAVWAEREADLREAAASFVLY
eukprot:Transcript_6960.p1 GENE.Transcript_6960~~Transcript_6960.p1  ORF type:complete len:352 (-),score=117.10 Transcript_6960:114-1169(-)